MSTPKKVLLGILTVLPLFLGLLYFILFFVFFINTAADRMHDPDIRPDEFPFLLGSFVPMMVLMLVAVVIGFALMIYYLIHISNNRKFDSTQRLLWILIVIFASTIGQIVYYIMEVWPDPGHEHNPNPPGS